MKFNNIRPTTRRQRVEAILSGDRVLLEDGTLADGYARAGERVLVSGGRIVEGAASVIAGELQRKQTAIRPRVLVPGIRPFRLILNGGDWERPYSGWLGRLLVFENGAEPKMYGIPHNRRYSGYGTFGCILTFGEELCRAEAICRNTYGEAPCEAPRWTRDDNGNINPLKFSCRKTWDTCKDRANFAGCPLTFGEPPCYADGTGDKCEYSARTCKALSVCRDDFGESYRSGYGGCKNTLATCQHTASFLPYAAELHTFVARRDSAPFEPSLQAFEDGYFVRLGNSVSPVGSDKNLSYVWIGRTQDGIHLSADALMAQIPSIPCGTMIAWMESDPEYTGIGVADESYSKGMSGQHYIVTVQWVLGDQAEIEPPSGIVVNTSLDGEDWSAGGQVVKLDGVEIEQNDEAPGYPHSFSRTEYRVGHMLDGAFGLQVDGNTVRQNNARLLYHLKGYIRRHCWKTEAGGWRRDYDEMWIRLMAGDAECTFAPAIIGTSYIPVWPAAPDGKVIDASDWPEGTLVSLFWFRFGGGGWPAGIYHVWIENGYVQLLIPVDLVLGYRDHPAGTPECLKVMVLMRYRSADGVNFTDGVIVTDAGGRYMTCQHSVPVCKWWDGQVCTQPDGFCGERSMEGWFRSLYPDCDGQGTAGYYARWSRYEPNTTWRGPGKYGRGHIKGYPPAYALAGCEQQGQFACRVAEEGYEGQWCARVDCPHFDPRSMWGASGVNVLDTLKSSNL